MLKEFFRQKKNDTDGNSDQHKEMNSIGNGKYVGEVRTSFIS